MKAKQRVHVSFRRRVLAAAVTVVVLLVLMWSSKDTTEKKTAKSSPVSNQLRQSALSPTAQATMQQHQSTPASISMSMAEAQLEAHLAAVGADSLATVEGFKKSAEEAEEVATRTAQDWEQSMQRSSGVTAQHANCSRASDCNHGLVCLRPHRPTVWAGGDRVCMGLEQAAHLRAEAMQALHVPGARARRRAAGDAARRVASREGVVTTPRARAETRRRTTPPPAPRSTHWGTRRRTRGSSVSERWWSILLE